MSQRANLLIDPRSNLAPSADSCFALPFGAATNRWEGMPVVSEMVHPRGLSFAMQRKVVIRRDQHDEAWPEIATQVRNLQGKQPSARTVANCYRAFSIRDGRVRTKYKNCGNTPSKVTKAVEQFLVQRLQTLRRNCVCTSTTLQHALAREKGVKLSASWIRKLLTENGYKWLPRSQKRQYSAKQMGERMRFAQLVLRLTKAQLRERLSLAMDGVVLGLPPGDATDRLNFCRYGDDRIWRKPAERFSPKLAGKDPYGKQVPMNRAIPLWGGCSGGGFSVILFHERKKLTVEEWAAAVRAGKLKKAIKDLKPVKARGPWRVLCDNESFLFAKAATAAHTASGVTLWRIPAKSPDLNPVERFWAWLRKRLRALDLADAVAKCAVLGKTAYKARVRRVVAGVRAQAVAANCAGSMRKVCKEVVLKKGAASSG